MIKDAEAKASKESKEFVEWVESTNPKFEVAVTLTFDDQPINDAEFDRILADFKKEFYRRVFRSSRRKAERKNPSKGLKVVVVKEGVVGIDSHIHMAIEIAPNYDYRTFTLHLLDAWKKQGKAGYMNKCKPYEDRDWLFYISKGMRRSSFDGMCSGFLNL